MVRLTSTSSSNDNRKARTEVLVVEGKLSGAVLAQDLPVHTIFDDSEQVVVAEKIGSDSADATKGAVVKALSPSLGAMKTRPLQP